MEKLAVTSEIEKTFLNFMRAKASYETANEVQRVAQRAYFDAYISSLESLRTMYDSLDESLRKEVLENIGGLAKIVATYGAKNAPAPSPASFEEVASPEEINAMLAECFPRVVKSGMTPGQKAAYTRRMNSIKKARETQEKLQFTKEKGKTLREKLGYSRAELASKLRLSKHYVASIESGQTEVGEKTYGKKIKRYLAWFERSTPTLKPLEE